MAKVQNQAEKGNIVKTIVLGGSQVLINDLYIKGYTKEELIDRFNSSGPYQIIHQKREGNNTELEEKR